SIWSMFCPSRFCFSLILRPSPSSTLFPYTTLFRSARGEPAPAGDRARLRYAHRRLPPGAARIRRLSPGSHARGHRRDLRRRRGRSEEHTSELQSPDHLVCRLLLEKKNTYTTKTNRV